MNQIKRIFIVGHPGSGKALFGKTLAEQLGWQFLDADFGLEYSIGRSIQNIMGVDGEQNYYQCQAEILKNLQSKEHIVVATDGSIACSEDNRELLTGEFVVFLHASTAVQMTRISRNPVSLLPVSDLKKFLDKMHSERDPLFEGVASVTVNSDDNALEEHVLKLSTMVETKQHAGKIKLEQKDSLLFHRVSHAPVYLTEQQAISLKLLAKGKSSKEIARDMNISHRTVEGTIAKTIELLGCTSSKELIALYHGQH